MPGAMKGGYRKLRNKLAQREGVRNPNALAAWIEDRKYGTGWRKRKT